MSPIKPSRFLVWPLATLGLAALGAGGLLAPPVRPPPPLASIQLGAQAIDPQALSPLSRFEARDGTWLAYRLYPAEDGRTDRLAIIAHGSSGLSEEMNVVARTLAESGVAEVAIVARGHGASGPLGAKVTLLPDVDHIGVVYRPAALGAIVTAAK